MPSFFEKLKKGMGIEENLVEEQEEEIVRKPKRISTRRILKETRLPILQTKKIEIKATPPAKKEREIEMKIEKEIDHPTIIEEPLSEETEKTEEAKEKWPDFAGQPEGQLAIDVYQTETDLVIQSAIAGIRPESLDITMEKDTIAIRGVREKPFQEKGDYFAQECYWGFFSREIILPVEIDPNQAAAKMKDGVLTIRMPKILREKKRRIVVTS